MTKIPVTSDTEWIPQKCQRNPFSQGKLGLWLPNFNSLYGSSIYLVIFKRSNYHRLGYNPMDIEFIIRLLSLQVMKHSRVIQNPWYRC